MTQKIGFRFTEDLSELAAQIERHLKICLVSRAPFLGGAEVACERLALGLLAAGQEVMVVLGERNQVAERFSQSGVPHQVLATPLRDKWHLPSYLLAKHRLRRFFQTWKPDVIHSNDLPTHQFVAAVAKRLTIPRLCYHRFVYPQVAIDWMNRDGAHCHCYVSHYLRTTLTHASKQLASEPGSVLYDGLPLPTVPSEAERMEARQTLSLPRIVWSCCLRGKLLK